MKEQLIKDILINALKEDMPYGDITTDNLISPHLNGTAQVTANQKGIIAGLDVFIKVFELVDPDLNVNLHTSNSSEVCKGDLLITLTGSIRSILKGERLALNLLQRLSGIATLTKKYCDEISDLPTVIVDTRKTTPNLRLLEKMAVHSGGGKNHRFSLSDAVMIKDNHIKASGGITNAVHQIKRKVGHTTKIEVEVTNLHEFREAMATCVDIIMLDNMSNEEMKEAVDLNMGKCILEASGNMTIDRIREVALTGVDIISIGALTHSVTALDISLNLID